MDERIANLLGRVARAGARASAIGLEKGPHITRYALYDHLRRHESPRPSADRVLSISHSERLAKILGWKDEQITDAAYPEHSMFDLPFADEEFDAVVSDQVLEHLEGDPASAIAETFRVLKPGGIALHTTCFINPVHACPNDYWRFTPQALELMTGKYGETLECEGWGNPYVWVYSALGLRFLPIPKARWHPAHWLATKNDPAWPIITWVLTRKLST